MLGLPHIRLDGILNGTNLFQDFFLLGLKFKVPGQQMFPQPLLVQF